MSNAEETAICNMNNEDENSADEGHSTDPVQKGEETIYEEVHAYLSRGCYPLEATKQEKGIINAPKGNLIVLHLPFIRSLCLILGTRSASI